MKNTVEFLGTVNSQSVIVVILVLMCVAGIVYWACKAVAKHNEKKQKENPDELGAGNINQLFKIREVDEDRRLGLLSADPTKEYSSGTGKPSWTDLWNVPFDLRVADNVIKVTGVSGDKIEISVIEPHQLPTEAETAPLREAREAAKAVAAAEAAVKALEVQKVT